MKNWELMDQIDAVKDIMNSIETKYKQSGFNLQSAVNRLIDAIDETALMVYGHLATGNMTESQTGTNSYMYDLLMNIKRMAIELLDQTKTATTVFTLKTLINALETINYCASPRKHEAENLLQDEEDILDEIDEESYMHQLLTWQTGILQEVLKLDKKTIPINFFIPHYHHLHKSFLTEMLPKLNETVDPELLKIYAFTSNQQDISYQQRNLFSGVAIGNFGSLMSTNNVFDVVYDMLPYKNNVADKINGVLDKVVWLKRYWNYTRLNGALVLALPSFALTRDVRLYLHKHFVVKGIRKQEITLNKEYPIQYYVLVLQKTLTNALSEEEQEIQYKLLSDLAFCNTGDLQFDLPFRFTLPQDKYVEVSMFKGSEPDIASMFATIIGSPLYRKQEIKPRKRITPLLPFEKGQIGLVLASGRLDGVIDEGNGFKHVILGRVYQANLRQETIINEEHPTGSRCAGTIEVSTTKNNLTEINVIGGNGTYKHITVPVAV